MPEPRSTRSAVGTNGTMERFAIFDPATLYEAAGQKGMIDPAIRAGWPGARMCGPAITVQCPPGDNLMLHVAVASAPAGAIIVATVGGFMSAGAWGEVLTAAAQARNLGGMAIDGAVRDIDSIRQAGFPVFSRGFAIGACTKERPGSIGDPVQFGGLTVRPGDLILGDGDGLVLVEQDRLDEVYAAALVRRRKESEIIAQLRDGRTTMELLGLRDPRLGQDGMVK